MSLARIKTFNALLKKLDSFRQHNTALLIRTYTAFKYVKQRLRGGHGPGPKRTQFNVRLSPNAATELSRSGLEGASVATAVYQFNNLIQNEISSDVYLDLLRFLIVLKNEALKHADISRQDSRAGFTSRRILANKLSQLDVALAQRSQSVYAGLEENPFGVYPSGVGLQRVIKALEAFAIMVISRFRHDWNGFVRFGHLSSRMEHYADILIVPMDISVTATRHWTFTHEVMHVLQTIDPGSLSLKTILRSDRFGNELPGTGLQPGSEGWFVLLESMADVLDFALCCSLSLDDYLARVWRFLDAEIFGQQARSQLSIYLWRSFAVIAFSNCATPNVDLRKLFDRNGMLSLLKRYTKKIRRWTDLSPLDKPDARGQEPLTLIYEQFLNEFVFYLPSMFRKVGVFTKPAPKLSEAIYQRAIKRLRQGQILLDAEIRYADKIAWRIGRETPSTRLDVAWLLSLWHQYQTGDLGPNLTALIEKSRRQRK